MEIASLLSAVVEAHSKRRGNKGLTLDKTFLENNYSWIFEKEGLELIDVIQVRENVVIRSFLVYFSSFSSSFVL